MSDDRLVPAYVRVQYEGGARGFKSAKRRALAKARAALKELRAGCAFFPDDGGRNVYAAAAALEAVQKQISIARWGR